MFRIVLYATFIVLLVFGGIFLFLEKNAAEIVIVPSAGEATVSETEGTGESSAPKLPPPKPLPNPPEEIKAIYATSWSAGTPSRVNYFIDLIENTELNAVVIDIKDFSGYVGYDTVIPEVEKYDAEEIRIRDIDSLIRRLHEKNIYVIARTTIFQDPRLVLARPDLAIKNKNTGEVWKDNKSLMWLDPTSQEVWDYNIAVVRDALSHGFDEINFDYIRFPSDGDIDATDYPFWDEIKPAATVIREFFQYLRKELSGAKISADIFGQTTVNYDDLGIGQIIENAYESFDYVSPMVYPSHYISNFLNLGNPAAYPYEVVRYSLERAFERLTTYNQGLTTNSTSSASSVVSHKSSVQLRPWLQAFDLGAIYTPEMVQREIQAIYDAASSTPELLNGFMLWNPSNVYDRRALEVEPL